MPTTDDEVLEVLIGKANDLMEKAARAQRFANEFAADLGKALPFENVDAETHSTGRVAIKADAFANTPTPSTAAREFLEMRKQAGAASFDEIFEALKRGGYHFGSSINTAKANLKIALGRDRQVRRLQNGHYGLWA